MFTITTEQELKDFNDAVKAGEVTDIKLVNFNTITFIMDNQSCSASIATNLVHRINYSLSEMDKLIYGKCPQTHIVNISYKNNNIHIFTENEKIEEHVIPYKHWVLSNFKNRSTQKLEGNRHYNNIREYLTEQEFQENKEAIWKFRLLNIRNEAEAFMIKNGMSYFKGMKVTDPSYLSFDIETTGLNNQASDAEVKIIANLYSKGNKEIYKLFRVDHYKNDTEMIQDWCKWVREMNPSILEGHNIYSFDLPYLHARSKVGLALGRDGSLVEFASKPSEKRKDGSQSYTYYRPSIFGREIIDTLFLIITADSQRKFESYGLKSLVKEMGKVEEDRVFIDASKIKQLWEDPEQRELICKYALGDVKDTTTVRKYALTSFFYFNQHIPKTLQQMMESATGGQINAFLLRAYLQDNRSVPKANDLSEEKVEGGISFGVPGIYRNLLKVDLKSCYPSQILRFKLHNPEKDPDAYYYKMVEYFTLKRFEYKKLGKETGDSYYKDLDAVSKIFINSSYGVANTSGLHFNDAEIAKKITKESREVIDQALRWASGKDYRHWANLFYDRVGEKEENKHFLSVDSFLDTKGINHDFIIGPTDTDSISICKNDMSEFTESEISELLTELNNISPEYMVFEDDGYYDAVVCLKAKNYVLKNKKGIIYKGSALKSSKLEPILKELLHECINDLLNFNGDNLQGIYLRYIKEALNPKDIKQWCQKKTVTKPILECADNVEARKNERDVYNAIKEKKVQEGDKIYVYPAILELTREETALKNGKMKVKETKVTGLKCAEDWNNDHDTLKLVDRVYATVLILSNIVGEDFFIDYGLRKNQELLNDLKEGH